MQIESSLLVVRRPHYKLLNSALYFLISNRPSKQLTTLEEEVWEHLQEPKRVRDLISINPKYHEIIAAYHKSEYIELAECGFPEHRRKILVIEPHADDAALSVGGTMWKMRNDCEFTLLTAASRSNFTSYYNLYRNYFDVNNVTALRRAESVLFCQMLGGKHDELQLTDAVLRYCDKDWDLEFFKNHRTSIAVATSRLAPKFEREKWKEKLAAYIKNGAFEEIWLPLGSPHSDHALTTSSIFNVLREYPEILKNSIFRIYQDVPYGARFPKFTARALEGIAKAGYQTQSLKSDIENEFKYKLRLISIYASQFKLKALLEDITANAYTLPDKEHATEQFWVLSSRSANLHIDDFLDCDEEKATEIQKTRSWVKKWKKAVKIRIILLNPPGQWKHDLDALINLFPFAKYEIYFSEPSKAEIFTNSLDRIIPRAVKGGTIQWLITCIRLTISKPAPTLFVGGSKIKSANLISKFWAFSDSNVISNLDIVSRILEESNKTIKV